MILSLSIFTVEEVLAGNQNDNALQVRKEAKEIEEGHTRDTY